MKYDFETVIMRHHTGSRKWGALIDAGLTEQDDIIPFSVADMEFVTAPEIVAGLKYELDHIILGYAGPTDEYKQTVCNWMKRRHNWDAQSDWILPAHGVIDAFCDAVKAFTKEGDGVMLMTPVYYPMYHAIRNNNRVLVDNALVRKGNTYEIDFDDFEKKAQDENTKMLILCSPHNPSGRVWTMDELKRIGDICLANKVLVISDEIHFDLISPGYKHTVFASICEEYAMNTVTLTAPSKTFNLAGMQTSNIFISNPELRAAYMKELNKVNPNPKCNILGYHACRYAYAKCEQWADEVNQVIDTNRQIIEEFMAAEFPQIQVMKLEGTYLLWMDWNGLGLDYRELERINQTEAMLFLDEGYIFGAQGEGFERWNLACPTKYIRPALERMKKAYSKYLV